MTLGNWPFRWCYGQCGVDRMGNERSDKEKVFESVDLGFRSLSNVPEGVTLGSFFMAVCRI
jgi:hypothetical protein